MGNARRLRERPSDATFKRYAAVERYPGDSVRVSAPYIRTTHDGGSRIRRLLAVYFH
jgi:hypothetical protein